MGQIRQAHCPVGAESITPTLRSQMLWPLLGGFALTSTLVFALAHQLGGLVWSRLSITPDTFVFIVLLLCASADLVFPRAPRSLFNRQTPRTLAGRFSIPVVGFLWGADTGLVISTIRASAASWAALALTFASWGPWLVGAAYAVGFCVPLGTLVLSYPAGGGARGERTWRRRSTESLTIPFSYALRYVRIASGAAALIGGALVASSVVL